MYRKDERLYRIWANMKSRCNNPNVPAYSTYGGRGISICDEWENDFACFKKWALENGYSDVLTIDRINNDGNYCPENCRWADEFEQANNKSNNRRLTYDGQTMTCTEWERELNLPHGTVKTRLHYGWSVERALTEPIGAHSEIPHYEGYGELHTLSEWSRLTGVATSSLKRRIDNNGQTIEEIVANKPQRFRNLTFEGKTQPLYKWAEEYGIDPSTLRRRIDVSGWSVEKALLTPVLNERLPKGTATLTCHGVTKPLTVWARELGISKKTLISRQRLGWSDEEILTRPVDKSRCKNQAKTA